MSPPSFIPTALWAQLLANSTLSAAGTEIDPPPVVKLFRPDAAAATWLA